MIRLLAAAILAGGVYQMLPENTYIVHVYTKDNCPPCARFKADLVNGLCADVAYVVHHDSPDQDGQMPRDSYPHFTWRRRKDGQRYFVDGWVSQASFNKTLAAAEGM